MSAPVYSNSREKAQLPLVKTQRIFQLLDLLLQPSGYTVEELSEALSCNRRTVYRYLHLAGEEGGLGYEVQRQRNRYRITSPGRSGMVAGLEPEEAALLEQRLTPLTGPDPLLSRVRGKLRVRTGQVVRPAELAALEPLAWAERLREAIREGRRVRVLGYRSTNSAGVRDRVAEPLYLSADATQVRVWEVAVAAERTYSLDRMQGLEVLEDLCTYQGGPADQPDLFGMSHTDWQPVELQLTARAHALLSREFAGAARCCVPDTDPDWPYRFRTRVRGHEGVGRFVLGLPTEVRVVVPDTLRDYVRRKVAQALW